MCQVVLAAAGGVTQIDPVGGLVAGACEKVGIDESLDPVDGMGVEFLPVRGKGTSSRGEQMGRQTMAADPGKQEKAGVVSEQVDVLGPCLGIPSDKAVTASDVPWS